MNEYLHNNVALVMSLTIMDGRGDPWEGLAVHTIWHQGRYIGTVHSPPWGTLWFPTAPDGEELSSSTTRLAAMAELAEYAGLGAC